MTHASQFLFGIALILSGCSEDKTNTEDASGNDTDTSAGWDDRFDEGVMPESIQNGGYIDSVFINRSGDRIYFIHSMYSPSVLDGFSTPDECAHAQASPLSDHVSISGLEWNTDIYFVEWDGSTWSEPVNIGAPVNTLGMECCMWLNDDETEIIYNSVSDLDGDGQDQDVKLAPTGNYRATRADRDSPWNTPEPLPGEYGTDQDDTQYRHDIHKAPSGNLYLWEKFNNGDCLLRFGELTGGSENDPEYASPVTIEGSTNYDTQVWANDTETRLIYNHRQANGETELYTLQRATSADAWGAPTAVSTTDFADSAGSEVWGEPTFDHSEEFMIFVRFDTTDSDCWTPDLMFSAGDPIDGYGTPKVLNK